MTRLQKHADWQQHLQAWETSGLTQSACCEQPRRLDIPADLPLLAELLRIGNIALTPFSPFSLEAVKGVDTAGWSALIRG